MSGEGQLGFRQGNAETLSICISYCSAEILFDSLNHGDKNNN